MKDMTGREIAVGDRIVYVSKPTYGGPKLTDGIVTEVDTDSVRVDRINAGQYLRDRKVYTWRRVENPPAGAPTAAYDSRYSLVEDPGQKPVMTRISMPRRCLIVAYPLLGLHTGPS